MQRRGFLLGSVRAAFGACLLPVAARAKEDRGTAGTKKETSSETLISDLERLIPKLLKEFIVPGLSIALIRDGRLLWQKGFGVRDSSSDEPVDNETIFEAASVSKTVFAYGVMKLCEKGIMNLDTPLAKYAPNRFLEGDPRLDLITARHVLSHTSGFQDWRSSQNPLKIHFTPGEKFLYSGEGYFYLQSVVTHLTGNVDHSACAKYEADLEVCATDIDSYFRKNLFEPFGMISSGYILNDSLANRTARPHDVQGKAGAKKKTTASDAARYASAGGLHTTATDYARFLIEVLQPKESDAFRLKRRSIQEMVRPHVKLNKGEEIDGANSWALGWAVQERKTGNIIVHSGGQNGFRSLAMASMERKSGFIMLTNSDNGGQVLYNQGLGDILNRLLEGAV